MMNQSPIYHSKIIVVVGNIIDNLKKIEQNIGFVTQTMRSLRFNKEKKSQQKKKDGGRLARDHGGWRGIAVSKRGMIFYYYFMLPKLI